MRFIATQPAQYESADGISGCSITSIKMKYVSTHAPVLQNMNRMSYYYVSHASVSSNNELNYIEAQREYLPCEKDQFLFYRNLFNYSLLIFVLLKDTIRYEELFMTHDVIIVELAFVLCDIATFNFILFYIESNLILFKSLSCFKIYQP